MRTDNDLLFDILDAIAAIDKYTSQGKDRYLSDELIQVWVLHHLQIIGEACRTLPKNVQDSEPSIPWKGIIGMRNILVHQYSVVDCDLVWELVENELPVLKHNIEKMMKRI